MKANLKFLIAVRHEVEHQMTRRIDETFSAKVQACSLNFNVALKDLAGARCGIDRDMAFAIQLSGIEREQRNMLLRDLKLPPNLLAAQETFEESLPDDIAKDERYAWRVLLVHKNTNSKGRADEVVEFVKPGSEVEGEIHRVLQKEVEKTKYPVLFSKFNRTNPKLRPVAYRCGGNSFWKVASGEFLKGADEPSHRGHISAPRARPVKAEVSKGNRDGCGAMIRCQTEPLGERKSGIVVSADTPRSRPIIIRRNRLRYTYPATHRIIA